MKRVLIYPSHRLDSGELDTLTALAQRLLQPSERIELMIVGDAPLPRCTRDNPGIRHVNLRRHGPAVGDARTAHAQTTTLGEVLLARSQTIRRAIGDFQPDLILVDGPPFGQYDELARILSTPWTVQVGPKWVLLLRDLIDCRAGAAQHWQERGYFDAIVRHYDKVVVLGDREVFDWQRDFAMPEAAAAKLEYQGYAAPAAIRSPGGRLRRALRVRDDEPLVLIALAPGAEGEYLLRCFLDGMALWAPELQPRCHIVCDPSTGESQRRAASYALSALPRASLQHSSRDRVSLMEAADLVVADASYPTICELLSVPRRALVVPSLADAHEQMQRARRLAELGLVRLVPPTGLLPEVLIDAVAGELAQLGPARRAGAPAGRHAVRFAGPTVCGMLAGPRGSVPAPLALASSFESTRGGTQEFELPLRIPAEYGFLGVSEALR
jgi:predicted glycosyltransferase